MAIDKSKENSRIADLLAMSPQQTAIKIIAGIKNPSILKQFMDSVAVENPTLDWRYAVAAGLLEWSDVEWIKEHVNEESEENEETGEPSV